MSEQDIPEVNDPDIDTASSAQETDELEALRAEVTTLKEQLLRRAAEFENFKRRTREEKDVLIKYGTESLLLNLLPMIDDFERSIDAGKIHPDFDSFYKGMEIIFTKMLRVLEQRGLAPIDAKGKPFDVDFHDALLQVPTTEVDPGIVLDVAEKGYMLHDKVIRHAKVTVSIAPSSADGMDQA